MEIIVKVETEHVHLCGGFAGRFVNDFFHFWKVQKVRYLRFLANFGSHAELDINKSSQSVLCKFKTTPLSLHKILN